MVGSFGDFLNKNSGYFVGAGAGLTSGSTSTYQHRKCIHAQKERQMSRQDKLYEGKLSPDRYVVEQVQDGLSLKESVEDMEGYLRFKIGTSESKGERKFLQSYQGIYDDYTIDRSKGTPQIVSKAEYQAQRAQLIENARRFDSFRSTLLRNTSLSSPASSPEDKYVRYGSLYSGDDQSVPFINTNAGSVTIFLSSIGLVFLFTIGINRILGGRGIADNKLLMKIRMEIRNLKSEIEELRKESTFETQPSKVQGDPIQNQVENIKSDTLPVVEDSLIPQDKFDLEQRISNKTPIVLTPAEVDQAPLSTGNIVRLVKLVLASRTGKLERGDAANYLRNYFSLSESDIVELLDLKFED